jgi:general nucleoside transport system permease protein
MTDQAETTPQGFKPSIVQLVIGVLAVVFTLIPIVVDGISLPRIILLVALTIAWVLWVWRRPQSGQGLIVPLLAIVTAFVVGAIVIALAAGQDEPILARLGVAVRGYAALMDGAFLKQNALSSTLVASTPLIFMGLAVAVGFRAGLFNIGAEGQYLIGAVFAVFIGYALKLPPVVHAVFALLAGALGGALWASIPGYLKARLGAHEVINTIMMNFIAIQLTDWLINNPMKDPGGPSVIRTPFIFSSAQIPQFRELLPSLFHTSDRLHLGFILAILAALFCWWLLWKTTVGFELRTAGSNPNAARYAGIRAESTVVMAMAISGALAGLAGAIEVQAVNRALPAFFQAGYGFDAIAIALLAQNHPFGVIPAGILFGALRTGSDVLQIRTGVSRHMVSIIQALILLFVAAPAMVRWLYRLRLEKSELEEVPLTRGWGG